MKRYDIEPCDTCSSTEPRISESSTGEWYKAEEVDKIIIENKKQIYHVELSKQKNAIISCQDENHLDKILDSLIGHHSFWRELISEDSTSPFIYRFEID